jgi:hypothetical protein
MSIKSAPLKAALLPQPPRHGLEPATRNLKPVTCNLFHTHVFENKIAARLPFSNQMDSRQSNLSTTVSKQGLVQWNHIRKRRGAPPLIFEKNTHFELHPEPASPGNQLQATSSEHSVQGSQLSTPSHQPPATNKKTKLLDNFYFRIKYITVRGPVDRLYTNKRQPAWNQIDKLSRPTPDKKRKTVFFGRKHDPPSAVRCRLQATGYRLRPARTIPVLNSFS